jgi:DNA-binding CsgD family transcriptional regulator
VAQANLTKREEEIRRLVVDGLTNEAIAARLLISPRTVEAHLRMLFRKTGASRRDQLAGPPDVPATAVEAAPAEAAGPLEERLRRLERQLGDREIQIRSYDAAIQRLVDRQFPLFDERVEIDLTVGTRPSEDMVVERHWTTPNPYLIFRLIRPITPLQVTYSEIAEVLAMTYAVENADVEVTADLVADSRDRPLVLLTFQPGLLRETEWVLRYRTPGMWDPLRERGEDLLTWAAGTLDGRHQVGLSDMVLRVEFPPGAAAGLAESRGIGDIAHAPTGDSECLVFRDSSRTGGTYRWTLRMGSEA